ncbi:hypothetical protein LWI28_019400 [Acer negundo]|uniref:MULE transposase domain-containing protein n=1 Tax=Acer negundo TaxID=4023 RepID=A0AAD5IWJ9_ACENE|nr:hypothetical protein LWI28_019400 [Acer negundo]
MVNQKEGYSKIGFTQKDMYNRIDAKRQDEAFESDSHAALMYLRSNANSETNFYCSTYKTNAYAKPLVLFVDVNNHRATCVFGVALLSDETVQSYIWVLNTLMDSMGYKHPISILTDGDEAMRQAIDEIFPNPRHRICGWHVSKNATTHLHKEEKKSPFRYLLYKQISEDEFKELWKEMLEQHGLEEND